MFNKKNVWYTLVIKDKEAEFGWTRRNGMNGEKYFKTYKEAKRNLNEWMDMYYDWGIDIKMYISKKTCEVLK